MESNIIILNEREKVIKFLDIFDNQEEHFCIVKINIKEIQYVHEKKQIYYDITYYYTYSSEAKEALRAHPFYYNQKIRESDDSNGVIIVKNNMTETMINYLLMNEEELSKQIGNTWWMQYKIKIMETLNLFWD